MKSLAMKPAAGFALVLFAVLAIAGTQAVFTVDQREQALVLQLGQPVGDIKGPGLHFKIPLVQEVRRFDRRILSVDPKPEQMVISSSLSSIEAEVKPAEAGRRSQTAGGEPIVVSSFVRYRITDPLKFMKTLRTVYEANQRVENILNDATRTALGKRTLKELLSTERAAVMADIKARVNRNIEQDQLGIEIVDVRIVRADLTPELRQSTVQRMISELRERATETRAKGEERALEIRSTAEKERTVLMAEANRDAQILKGQGDREAIGIYAAAFGKDPDFYDFMRSMDAYRKTMANQDTRLILSPGSAFLKYFVKPE